MAKSQLEIKTSTGDSDQDYKRWEDYEYGSITPKTIVGSQYLGESRILCKHKYMYADTSVVHFSASPKNIQFIQKTPEEQSLEQANLITTIMLAIYILAKDDQFSVKCDDEKEDVTSTIKSSGYKKSDSDQITHHEIEKDLFSRSIKYLLDNRDEKTVLVDFFRRELNEEKRPVKVDKNGHPEIHTVLLYKNPIKEGKHDVLVIDPSNFFFSSHLTKLGKETQHDILNEVVTLHKKLEIYKPKKPTGPGDNEYRDCTDIAVKLAFGLNKFEMDEIELSKISSHSVVKFISNMTSIDNNILYKDGPTRIKQASNYELIKAFYEAERSALKSLKIITDLELNEKADILRNEFIKTLKSNDNYKNTLTQMLNLNEKCYETISSSIITNQEELAKIIGEVFSSEES